MEVIKLFKIGSIGAGHMGMAILDSLIECGLEKPRNILVYELAPERQRAAKTRSFAAAGSEIELYSNAERVMLAVPPQTAEVILGKLAKICDRLQKKPVIINIMAGISSSYIKGYLGSDTPVITVMPSMGMKSGHGAAAIAHTEDVPDEDISYIMKVFYATGEAAIVDEPLLKEIVAVNGCMPGYVLYILEAFAREAETQGIDYNMALRMAARGFIGAAMQILEGGTPKEMLARVCTPGGLTAAGIASFENDKLAQLLGDGMANSTRRGYELSK